MKFDEMEIKGIYDSEQVNVYHKFFNKLLPESKMYQRFGGFFSSKNFAHCAQGLQDFIKNNRTNMYWESISSEIFFRSANDLVMTKTNDKYCFDTRTFWSVFTEISTAGTL